MVKLGVLVMFPADRSLSHSYIVRWALMSDFDGV